MKKMNTVQPLFPHLRERLAGLVELASGRTNAGTLFEKQKTIMTRATT